MNEFTVITAKDEWREELKNYRGDWYHSWDYHQIASKSNEGKPMLFVLTNDLNQRLALPLLLRDITGTDYKDMTSVYGYPGFLLSSDSAIGLFEEFQQRLFDWANGNSVVSIFSRLNSLVVDTKSLDGCYLSGETVVVDLTIDEDEQRKRYRKNYRNLLRRLEREGFRADWSNTDESLNDFKQIYTETMKGLNAGDYYFFDDAYYSNLLDSKDFEVRIYNVWLDELKVCSGMFVFCDDIVQYHLSGTLKEYKELAPTRMLIDKARKDATELGYKYLHLGGGLGAERDSLFNFKFGFSKESIEFYVFKKITNMQAYKMLSNLDEDDAVPETGYFPLYRKVN
ncbi:hypothetical protein C3B51_09365 [Pseudoalteromonas rubra]|uniref:BioF2-like acetyltransferase domain-containing protein n=1 Tax=Pseudoalteromonas rubra TaxID=43658 RepID=A0A4Q7EDW8_9GAMM|nr:GNAT family N-acetyltransferase [Pseudoalteromonas rubra]RZM81187.1 hypothetical protein C3B51_09365 [Pseudoalteromonas rubra]